MAMSPSNRRVEYNPRAAPFIPSISLPTEEEEKDDDDEDIIDGFDELPIPIAPPIPQFPIASIRISNFPLDTDKSEIELLILLLLSQFDFNGNFEVNDLVEIPNTDSSSAIVSVPIQVAARLVDLLLNYEWEDRQLAARFESYPQMNAAPYYGWLPLYPSMYYRQPSQPYQRHPHHNHKMMPPPGASFPGSPVASDNSLSISLAVTKSGSTSFSRNQANNVNLPHFIMNLVNDPNSGLSPNSSSSELASKVVMTNPGPQNLPYPTVPSTFQKPPELTPPAYGKSPPAYNTHPKPLKRNLLASLSISLATDSNVTASSTSTPSTSRNSISSSSDLIIQTEDGPVKVNPRRLFVGNLPFSSTWIAFKSFLMKRCEELDPKNSVDIQRVEIPMQPQPFMDEKRSERGVSRGFAIVTTDLQELLETLINWFDDVEFEGRKITVRFDRFPDYNNHFVQQMYPKNSQYGNQSLLSNLAYERSLFQHKLYYNNLLHHQNQMPVMYPYYLGSSNYPNDIMMGGGVQMTHKPNHNYNNYNHNNYHHNNHNHIQNYTHDDFQVYGKNGSKGNLEDVSGSKDFTSVKEGEVQAISDDERARELVNLFRDLELT